MQRLWFDTRSTGRVNSEELVARMARRRTFAIFLIIAQLRWTSGSSREVKELCQFDSFYGRCAENEIIVIDYALYGRMKVGKCISGEGYIGCETDVRAYVDSACAGRHHCNVSVTSLTDVVQPCRRDYTSYLEVAYSCKAVATDVWNHCRLSKRNELTPLAGLLASVVALETGAGSVQCPWEIRGQSGQQVRLKLVIYRPGVDTEQAPGACQWFVIVEEGERMISEALCGRIKNQKVLFVSEKNFLRLYVTWEGKPENAPIFVVQYEIIGCPDIVTGPASGAVVTRTGEELVVRCLESRETWYLTCSGNIWIGDFDNCSTSSHRSSQKSPVSATGVGGGGGIPFPQGLVIAVILGLILGLFIGSASLAALFVFRRRRHRSSDAREEDDDYATEKLRTSDIDPDSYRSTFSGYHTGLDRTTIDLSRSPRCLAFYSGGSGRPLTGSTYTGRTPSECMTSVGSPIRNFAIPPDVPCVRLQSMTYETTRLSGGGAAVGGGSGGSAPLGVHDPPKPCFEQDPEHRKPFGAVST